MNTPPGYYDIAIPDRFATENIFSRMPAEHTPLPDFAFARALLPEPSWQGHPQIIACYWKAWEIAFGNLRQPAPGSPLIANFIDTAFNDSTFMWDSAFMTMFGRYGIRAFNFQRTLDNFYALQHRDGYISREIRIADGSEKFDRFDPSSTGPNMMPWAEWEYFQQTGDKDRLGRVFPTLVAYTRWFRKHRTWPDGTYWSSGLGCGMDNQPRLPEGCSVQFDHGHMAWIDTTLQAIFTDKLLLLMAVALGRVDDVKEAAEEADHLTNLVNKEMWNNRVGFYCDRFRDGNLSDTKSIGGYWALLANIVPEERIDPLLAHLSDPKGFKTPHRVATLSADHPNFSTTGNYWCGSVWPPTNYMVLRGLTRLGADGMAHEIACNHLANVVEVFQNTGTLFENYAPKWATPGDPARRDFVGWTGLSPIAIFFEYVLGLRPEAAQRQLVWDVRLLEEHGVKGYPFGSSALLDLKCAKRDSPSEEPVIEASSNEPLALLIKWAGGQKILQIKG
ncbi:MAG: hypothetical protein LV481_11085 [Methylacidiphilales bacterium]|nr:hypothetical protein [Candidatus Methylacidiphilales bacterium]